MLPVLCCGPATAPLGDDEREQLAARFRALADPTRVAIVNRLAAADEVRLRLRRRARPGPADDLAPSEGAARGRARRGELARHVGVYRLVPEAVGALRQALGA